MRSLLIVVGGTYGTHLVISALLWRWTGWGVAPRRERQLVGPTIRVRRWMDEAGLVDVSTREFLGVTAGLGAVGSAAGGALFGGILPALGVGAFLATVPAAAYRVRRADRRAEAEESWPALIEEIRVLTGSAGRSIPQSIFEVGARGPVALRDAFAAAHRDWLLVTDFPRSLSVLRSQLGSPTADMVCETLLVAHEVGAGDLDRRLAELAEDRRHDVMARKDARAKQSGVRFARRFVIAVPAGMAAAGMSLGDGRASFQTPMGQTMVLVGIGLVVVCWIWSGRMLRLPVDDRVFA